MNQECRHSRRDILRRKELDATERLQLDLHLRRCNDCGGLAEELASIEAFPKEIPEMSEQRQQEVFRQLVPLVHELTNGKEQSQFVLKINRLRRAFTPRMAFAVGFAAVSMLVVMVVVQTMGPMGSTQISHDEVPSNIVQSMVIHHDGLIDRSEGTVSINGNNPKRSGHFKVSEGTSVFAHEGSRFSFRIGSIARVALFANTEWQLTKATNNFIAMHLEKGQLAIDFNGESGHILEVSTPNSLVRVKGTIFTVEVADGQTRVGVVEGLVQVVSLGGELQTYEVAQSQLVSVPGPNQVVPISEEQKFLAAEFQNNPQYPKELTRLVRFDGSPEKAKIEIDGRVLGTTPLTVRLPDAPQSYRVSAPEMEPIVGNLAIRVDQEDINFALIPTEIDNGAGYAVAPKPKKRRIVSQRKRSWGLFKRARAAMTAGDIPYAIGLLEKGTKTVTGGQLVSELQSLAECYVAVGDYTKAADTYGRIVEISPGSAAAQNARYEVGRLSMDRLGDISRARASFTAYVASPLGGALKEEAYYSLCELNGRQGASHRDALHCFNEFLRAFPGGHHEPDARLWRGVLNQDMGISWAESERDLLVFVRSKPNHPRSEEARYRVIIGRHLAGDERGSLRMIAEYLKAHPKGQYRLRVERLRHAILDPETQ